MAAIEKGYIKTIHYSSGKYYEKAIFCHIFCYVSNSLVFTFFVIKKIVKMSLI